MSSMNKSWLQRQGCETEFQQLWEMCENSRFWECMLHTHTQPPPPPPPPQIKCPVKVILHQCEMERWRDGGEKRQRERERERERERQRQRQRQRWRDRENLTLAFQIVDKQRISVTFRLPFRICHLKWNIPHYHGALKQHPHLSHTCTRPDTQIFTVHTHSEKCHHSFPIFSPGRKIPTTPPPCNHKHLTVQPKHNTTQWTLPLLLLNRSRKLLSA